MPRQSVLAGGLLAVASNTTALDKSNGSQRWLPHRVGGRGTDTKPTLSFAAPPHNNVSGLEQARKDARIGHVSLDPVLPIKAFFDIGGAGHSSDAMAIWVCQFAGREIRLLDYIEGVGQPLGYYAAELRRRGWKDGFRHAAGG
jgi:hypothetical protein